MSKATSRISFAIKTNVPAVTADVERRLRRALDRIGIKWQAEAKKNISPGSANAAVDTGRLRASIAFSSPNVQAVHTEAYAGSESSPGGVVSYPVPKLDARYRALTVGVGSNVEYAAAVHEGINAQVAAVNATRVRAHQRKRGSTTVHVRAHERAAHTRNVPARAPRKFIEEPMRANLDTFRKMTEEELKR